jgi:hypothetical protein
MEGGKNGIEEFCFFVCFFGVSCMVPCYNLLLFIPNAKIKITTYLGFCDQLKK